MKYLTLNTPFSFLLILSLITESPWSFIKNVKDCSIYTTRDVPRNDKIILTLNLRISYLHTGGIFYVLRISSSNYVFRVETCLGTTSPDPSSRHYSFTFGKRTTKPLYLSTFFSEDHKNSWRRDFDYVLLSLTEKMVDSPKFPHL